MLIFLLSVMKKVDNMTTMCLTRKTASEDVILDDNTYPSALELFNFFEKVFLNLKTNTLI